MYIGDGNTGTFQNCSFANNLAVRTPPRVDHRFAVKVQDRGHNNNVRRVPWGGGDVGGRAVESQPPLKNLPTPVTPTCRKRRLQEDCQGYSIGASSIDIPPLAKVSRKLGATGRGKCTRNPVVCGPPVEQHPLPVC